MCLKIWYMPLSLPLILHTCICIHTSITPKKRGLNCGSMTCPTGGAPNINYGKSNYGKNNYGKK